MCRECECVKEGRTSTHRDTADSIPETSRPSEPDTLNGLPGEPLRALAKPACLPLGIVVSDLWNKVVILPLYR